MEPLREQIQDRYSTFFGVSDEAELSNASGPVVTLVSDSIIDHFRKSTKTVDIENSPADDSIEVKLSKVPRIGLRSRLVHKIRLRKVFQAQVG